MFKTRRNKLASLVFFLFCCSEIASAQWVKQADNALKLKLGVLVPRFNVEVDAPPETSASKLKLEPNAPTKTLLGFSYRNIGGSVSVANPVEAEKIRLYGSSSSTDLQLRFFGKRTYEFYYQTYQGYYVTNSEDVDPSYVGQSLRIQRPDIKTKNYGLNFYWSQHEKDYSQAVAWDQAGIQENSGWGLSWLVHLSQTSIEANAALVPSISKSSFGLLGSLQQLQRTALASGVGIGGITTFRRFYLSGLFALGYGYQNLGADFVSLPSKSYDQSGVYTSLRLGLGFNGEKNVVSFQILNDSVQSTIANGQVIGNTIELSLSYAYRFGDVDLPFLNKASSYLDP